VVRFGTNRSGTQRLWCKVCRQSFTPDPKDRCVTPEKAERIDVLLCERLSQRAVARAPRVSRDTIRRTLKNRPSPSG
jgi:transposase-like protein